MTGSRLSDRERALLVGLADDTLPDRKRGRAEALPDAARLIERQRRVARALSTGPEPAAAATPVVAAAPRARVRLAPRLALGAVVAGLLILFAVPQREQSLVAQAAALSMQPATRAAPESAGPVLRAGLDGVPFPDWSAQLGWHATGARRDTLGKRPTRTVFYEHMGHRIAYTIISGPPLELPGQARIVRKDGLEIAFYRDPDHGGHDVAVFQRGGRTCVVAGHVERVSTLVRLAAWTGDGAVRSEPA